MAEDYKGIKFETNFIASTFPIDNRLKELKKWGKLFDELELAPRYPGGSAGNMSYRFLDNSDEFIITASHTALDKQLCNSSFVHVKNISTSGVINIAGTKTPSSESRLHHAIYQNRKDVNAILHGHFDHFFQLENIPCTIKFEEYGTIELINSVLNILENHHFILLKDHGFIAMGENIESAGKLTLSYLNKIKK